jgi:phosphohistidine phosphatase SixA
MDASNMAGNASWKWIGIMRHGQAFRPGTAMDKWVPGSSLTTEGLSDAIAVGRRFAEAISEYEIDTAEVTIVCARSRVARDTAAALRDQLRGSEAPVPLKCLDPATWPADPIADASADKKENPESRWRRITKEIPRREARFVVVVGHDPQVSWLLHHLVEKGGRGQWRAGPLPLARGELAMLDGPPEKAALRWVLSPSDEKVIGQLQEKIKSKMDSAKLLGAFLTALLVFSAKELAGVNSTPAWYPWVAGLGLVSLAMATAAYFVTMFKYDELLMPVRFWPSPRPEIDNRSTAPKLPRGFVRRPPSSAAWVLYQNMMHVWNRAFIPATLLGGVGAIAVAVALAQPDRFWWLAVGSSIVALVALTFVVWLMAEPKLGVSD